MSPTIIIVVLIITFFLYLWFLYNGLVTAKVRIREAWSQIEVQLKRRSSLIPNLIETVKGYTRHERAVFENVTKARSALVSAKNPKQAATADNVLTGALKTLFAIAEAYPNLRASENFKQLQEELSDTETKIAASRQFYNANVMDYNTKIKVFPNVFLARLLNFSEEEFFEAEEESKKDIKVKF
ncbi:LemA family protein [Candidatus Curtissbacteria bacterium]|nr:LemA family protein [Candidatus Curtissbacteria bacterium]